MELSLQFHAAIQSPQGSGVSEAWRRQREARSQEVVPGMQGG
jgi:hypothetical protein